MELTERMALARSVKSLRQSEGLSQEALGNKIKVSRSTIYAVEKGEGNIGFDVVEALANYFSYSVYGLIARGQVDQADFDFTVPDNRKTLIRNLKRLMLEKNMKAGDLAKAAGIELSTFYSYMNEQRTFQREKVAALARALGVDETTLVKRAGADETPKLAAPQNEVAETLRLLRALEAKLNLIDERMLRGFAAIEAILKKK